MDENKIRIRSKEELESRERGFLEIVDILEKNNIFFFIQAGTALGARREGYFIKWDWDVEIGIFEKDFLKNYDIIRSELVDKKFQIFHEIKSKKDGKIDVTKEFNEKSTVFEILSWNYSFLQKKYYRWHINIPSKFFEKKHTIKFLDRELNCPGPIDDYLTYQYGDWQTPKRTSLKEEYLTKSFFKKKNNIVENIKNKLKSISKILK